MTDEEKKAIEYWRNETDWANWVKPCDMSYIVTLLNLIEKQQNELQQEKEKNKKLQIRCKELIEEKQELNTALLYDNISKDKIKEKMKIIENECKTCKYNHLLCEERKPLENSIKYCLKLECYDVLKSLLEEN